MAEQDKDISLALYQYLCRNIVGTEKHVTTIRLMNAMMNKIVNNPWLTIITSGSFGEGIELKGSDHDIMFVLGRISVFETTSQVYTSDNSFVMETEDTKPGFTKLRLVKTNQPFFLSWCVEHGNTCNHYISNVKFKEVFFANSQIPMTNHGPCLSDKEQLFDGAFCLHNKLWIHQARAWVTRSNNSWPDDAVKQTIIDHGVLFVPVGVKGSPNEEVEWRISFSVGEKFLIYTFSHTQLMCYVLLKILLKDVISTDDRCKELLCSYFLKTIIFWLSEEISFSHWIPMNLMCCFMRCLNRLIYCVKYSTCPHYFIPENNLFENKIEGIERQILLENLMVLRSYDWRCILFSNQFSNFQFDNLIQRSVQENDCLIRTLKSRAWEVKPVEWKSYVKAVRILRSSKSAKIKRLSLIVFFVSCTTSCQLIPINNTNSNKHQYKQFRNCQSYILQGRKFDAVSPWLLLSSLFYKMKQYNKALYTLSYSLSKCTTDKVGSRYLFHDKEYCKSQKNCLNRVICLRHLLQVKYIHFFMKSPLIPDELNIEVKDHAQFIAPVVYAHFLRFLCYRHLGKKKMCLEAALKLTLTIKEKYFIFDRIQVASSFNCAGIALQMLGQHEIARLFYMAAVECDSEYNSYCALQRLESLTEHAKCR